VSQREIDAHEKQVLLASPERVLATLNKDGTRRWVRPRLSPGRHLRLRRAVAYVLMAIFVAVPFIKVGGAPLMLLNIPAREFVLGGVTFKPTDTYLLMLLLLGIFGTVFLLTALFGRVWCGWACPQTVYMEFLFRPLERLFEGTYQQQRKLDRTGGGLRRVAKNIVFALIACFLAHTFLAYFVGWGQLIDWMTSSPANHPVAFMVMAGVTAAMVLDFTWFREQTCLVACPYGRFQSVLLDRDSLIVGYDPARGEPRGKPGRKGKALPVAEQGAERGDCIDCGACVLTCPTGIDIRNGLQMECIHCTQCMDACDAIMQRIDKPTGLIRYTSQNQLSGAQRRLVRPRVAIYVAAILAVGGLLALGLSRRGATYVTLLRGLGAPFAELPSGEVHNQVRLKIQNQGAQPLEYLIEVPGLEASQLIAPENPLAVDDGDVRTATVFVKLPREAFRGSGRKQVTFRIHPGEGDPLDLPYTLLGPSE
jgi:cytochrome c oxidase accessory protein FixG